MQFVLMASAHCNVVTYLSELRKLVFSRGIGIEMVRRHARLPRLVQYLLLCVLGLDVGVGILRGLYHALGLELTLASACARHGWDCPLGRRSSRCTAKRRNNEQEMKRERN
jgi:hypothetical protein